MSKRVNFKKRLKNGERLVGSWLTFSDPCVAELMCQAGFDFLILDAEHAPLSIETIQRLMMVINATGVTGIIRVPWNEPVIIKQVMDVGAEGIMVPLVTIAADVEKAVSAARYPPEGVAGMVHGVHLATDGFLRSI